MKNRVAPPSPKPKPTQVQSHLHKINAKSHGIKEETKAIKSKKKTGKPKHSVFTMGKMTAKRVFNWPRLFKFRNSGIL
jgi:hypothetical protein